MRVASSIERLPIVSSTCVRKAMPKWRQWSEAMEIDIALDLKGFTQDARPRVCWLSPWRRCK